MATMIYTVAFYFFRAREEKEHLTFPRNVTPGGAGDGGQAEEEKGQGSCRVHGNQTAGQSVPGYRCTLQAIRNHKPSVFTVMLFLYKVADDFFSLFFLSFFSLSLFFFTRAVPKRLTFGY